MTLVTQFISVTSVLSRCSTKDKGTKAIFPAFQ